MLGQSSYFPYLQGAEYTRVSHAGMAGKESEAPAENVKMPKYLKHTGDNGDKSEFYIRDAQSVQKHSISASIF